MLQLLPRLQSPGSLPMLRAGYDEQKSETAPRLTFQIVQAALAFLYKYSGTINNLFTNSSLLTMKFSALLASVIAVLAARGVDCSLNEGWAPKLITPSEGADVPINRVYNFTWYVSRRQHAPPLVLQE